MKKFKEFLENFEAYMDKPKGKGWRSAKSKIAPTTEITSQEEIANGLDMEGTK
jgi:hypothetical protein